MSSVDSAGSGGDGGGDGCHRGATATSLTQRYLQRLGWNQDTITSVPRDYDLLARIQQAHLSKIPFENLSQHGCPHKYPPVPPIDNDDTTAPPPRQQLTAEDYLDINATACKILDYGRGGFCYEVNLLLGKWLEQLGYNVCRVPCVVFGGDVTGGEHEGFNHSTSHVVLIVSCPPTSSASADSTNNNKNNKCQQRYYVEVGFGEPPIHPIKFDDEYFGVEQRTMDGLRSRFDLVTLPTNSNGDVAEETTQTKSKKTAVQLQMYKSGKWSPQLQWDYDLSFLRDNDGGMKRHYEEFIGINLVLRPNSVFSQKLICCRLDPDKKLTLAGTKFKTTHPRGLWFEQEEEQEQQSASKKKCNDTDNDTTTTTIMIDGIKSGPKKITINEITNNDDGRRILQEQFGIMKPEATVGLNLGISQNADESIWDEQ